MACSAMAQRSRAVLPPSCDCPAALAGFSVSESRGFSRKSQSSSSSRRCLSRPVVLSLHWSGGYEKMLLLRLGSCPDLFYGQQSSDVVKWCGKDLWRRKGLKRSRRVYSQACSHIGPSDARQSGWKNLRSIGIVPRTASPIKSRKHLRCWDDGAADAGQADEKSSSSVRELSAAREQAIQVHAREETRLFFSGPAKGDLAEIEAFCRIYRNAEQLNSTVMNALRTNSVDGDTDGGDVSLVEEKIATGLAHLMAKLQEGRSEILGVKPISGGNSAAEVEAAGAADGLSPFAHLRKEVRARCETVEAALNSLFPAGSAQHSPLQARLQKLKNVCLDAGFPRPEGIPGHADIPNLAPVQLRASRGGARTVYTDEDVAFWRGGQVTEAGLDWLVDKQFKTIVDLREAAAQPLALKAAAAGRLRVVRISVERGSVPSEEQVEKFALLVAESGTGKALYLHTLAGVGRASAMVSRWREFVLREQQRLGKQEGKLSGGVIELPRGEYDIVRISQEDALALANFNADRNSQSSSSDETSLEEGDVADIASGLRNFAEDAELSSSADVEAEKNERSDPSTANGSTHGQEEPFNVTENALEAQRPVPNVFSRKEMSKFMKHKKIPPIFLTSRIDRSNGNFASPSNIAESLVSANIAGPANRWGLANPGIPRGGVPRAARLQQQQQPEEVTTTTGSANGPGNGTAVTSNGYTRFESTNGTISSSEENSDESNQEEQAELSETVNGSNNEAFVEVAEGPQSGHSEDEADGPCSVVEGDMCASTTGVVRLQSRKKAEMFLVRTDGYSCVRERVKESTLAFSHPSTQQQMLMWKTPPRTVLLLKKLGSELTKETQEVASFLHHQEGMNVMVEPEVHDRLARVPGFGFVQTFHTQDTGELHERVDFVVCLGGDGVILHTSNLFRNAVPPVVSFNLGSLGFLTSHNFSGYREDLQEVIHGHNDMLTGVYITLRMRLRCELYRGGNAIPGKVFDVLNEVVVDRGSNPYLSKIECFERNRLITKVQADGVIVATPTGSTAYSIAAGGSMVHPNVPCMLFTPICPHSLSFRPVILPDSALLELKVPNDARNNAWVSFDGKRRQQLSKGDSVRICMSEHPLPTVNKSDQTDDWFQSLVRCLSWNERLEQRPLSAS